MTVYAAPPITPNALAADYTSNAELYVSPISNYVQANARQGELLSMRLSYRNLTPAKAAQLRGWLVRLNGREHRFLLHNYAEAQQGAYGGTPLVAGAGQLGNTLNIDGCSNGITGWTKAGDWISVNSELKIITADADSDGAGLATLEFRPRLRQAPADNAAIDHTAAQGIFMLDGQSVAWAERPGKDGPLFDVTFAALEDTAA
jgi:hypothetical protein